MSVCFTVPQDNMRSFKFPRVRFVVVLLFLTFPAAAQKVTTTSDKSFNFQTAKRYAWGKNHIITRQGRANDALIDKEIVRQVNRALAAKGFTEDPANPDFYISYEAGASDLSVQMEGEYADPKTASTAATSPIYGIPQNVWYSVDGHITFQVVNAKSNEPVWKAVATKKIRDPHKGMKDMPKQIEQMVSKAFKKFPPPQAR